MCNVALAEQTKLTLRLVYWFCHKTLVGVRFSQLHGSIICMGFFSPVLLNKYVCPLFVLVLYGMTNTDWLKLPDMCLPQLHDPKNNVLSYNCKNVGFITSSTNFEMGLLSLSLVSQKFIAARFAQPHGMDIYRFHFFLPSGPKQILLDLKASTCIGCVSLELLDPNIF